MARCCRVDRDRVFLLIFARSSIPLVSPAEASPPRQPNKRVQRVPRQCRASLQTAPRVPSPHLVYYGRAPGDGTPFISGRGETRCCGERRRHRGNEKRRRRCGIMILPHRRQFAELFRTFSRVRANCRSRSNQIWTIRPDRSLKAHQSKFHMKTAKASGPDQPPPRGG